MIVRSPRKLDSICFTSRRPLTQLLLLYPPMSSRSMIMCRGTGPLFDVGNPLYRWCFTLFAKTMDEGAMYRVLKEFCKKFVFQEEKSPTTGLLHFQGRFTLKVKMRLPQVLQAFKATGLQIMPHLEPERDQSLRLSEAYCMKSETRTRGPWMFPLRYEGQDLVSMDQLSPWQCQLLSYLCDEKSPDKREIIWVFDPVGGTGKTMVGKYLAVHHGADVFGWVIGKNAMHAIALLDHDPTIVLFDLTRAKPNQFGDADLYSTLEQIKNGVVRDQMYDSGVKLFLPPHVVVFANQLPDRVKLSVDRWNVITLDESDSQISKRENVRKFVLNRPNKSPPGS